MLSCSVVSDSATLWTLARQAPLSMEFSRQEYWSGLPCPPPGDLPNPGIKPRSLSLQVDFLPSESQGIHKFGASLVVQMVKDLPAMQVTWVQSLGWEDPLEEGMATHSSIFAWRIPKNRGAWWVTFRGVAKSQT